MTQRDIKRLAGVHPELQRRLALVLQEMEALGAPMFVAGVALRTVKEQQELYAQGRTKPGKIVTYADGVINRSNHQPHADGYGHAVDCAFTGGEPYGEQHPWATYGRIAKKHGLAWGGDWRKPDRPHVEWKDEEASMTPQEALARHEDVLDGTKESAGRFTQRVAWDLRATHVLIRKTGGERCAGPGVDVDCDKVMDRGAPYRIYDIVVAAGSSANRPTWGQATNHDGSLAFGRADMAVEPVAYGPEPVPNPNPTPEPPPPPAPCRFQPTDMTDVLHALATQAQLNRDLVDALNGLKADVADVRKALKNGLAIEGGGTGSIDIGWAGKRPVNVSLVGKVHG